MSRFDPASAGLDYALVTFDLTQILAGGSGCMWMRQVSLITLRGDLFDVNLLLDLAYVPLLSESIHKPPMRDQGP